MSNVKTEDQCEVLARCNGETVEEPQAGVCSANAFVVAMLMASQNGVHVFPTRHGPHKWPLISKWPKRAA